jgi:hypothetical protein
MDTLRQPEYGALLDSLLESKGLFDEDALSSLRKLKEPPFGEKRDLPT